MEVPKKTSAQKVDDRSEGHLRWLVSSRSHNQKSSLDLFLILESHPTINSRIDLQQIAQSLTSVVFSLWRSVFLSDLTDEADNQMADVNLFLGNLISNNTIAYQQDKNAREFTCRYYLSDANFRLGALAESFPAILKPDEFVVEASDVKTGWSRAQAALDIAITRFAEILDQPPDDRD